MSLKSAASTLTSCVRDAARSRIAWLPVCAHALWFFLAIASMSPPSPGLGEFLDRGGGSSATLLAGRPFHFHYESAALKVLVLSDLPATIVMLPVSLAFIPLAKVFGFGFYGGSYVSAGLMFVGGTCQWLLVGRRGERWIERRSPAARRILHRLAILLIVSLVATTAVLTPVVNERSRALGFKHGGISFR